MINVEQALHDKFPALASRTARLPYRPIIPVLRRVLHEREINDFLDEHGCLRGLDFVERALERLEFSYRVCSTERENVPVSGRLIVVSNHPLGALDAFALLGFLGEVRRDVRVLGNDLLAQVAGLAPLLLPVDNMRGGTSRAGLRAVIDCLEREQVLVVFPAGEVSRLRPNGVRDGSWSSGFLRLAERTGAPLLPVHISGRNSSLFYGTSMIWKPLAAALLSREMFRQRAGCVDIRVGCVVPAAHLSQTGLSRQARVRLVKRHVYRLARRKPSPFATLNAVAHPEDRRIVRDELAAAELLHAAADGKTVQLWRYEADSAVLREIGRLREVTFRSVGEGTNRRRDLDRHDLYYDHVVLWDPARLEIAGAYRLVRAARAMERFGQRGLYTSTLFRFEPAMDPYLYRGVELGRSFIQRQYWRSRSLDQLWMGIGAYLLRHPGIRYLFGPVTLSEGLPARARELLVGYYAMYFPADVPLARARAPFDVEAAIESRRRCAEAAGVASSASRHKRLLREELAAAGSRVPALYKHYTELCEPGGLRFLDFCVDPAFGHCTDGLVLVDLAGVRAGKLSRYLAGGDRSTAPGHAA